MSALQLERRLASEIESRLGEIVDDMVQAVREQVPDLAEPRHPELWGGLRRSAVEDVRAGMSAFDLRTLPGRLSAGGEQFARAAAEAGITVVAVLHAYRVAQGEYWRKVFVLVENLEAPVGEKLALLRAITSFGLRYVDHLSVLGADQLQREREQVLRRRETTVLALAREAIAGGAPDLTPVGYELSSNHLAVIITGDGASEVGDALAAAHERRALTATPESHVCWVWLELTPEERGAHVVEIPRDHTTALGRPAPGAEGFRVSHRQALLAHEVGRALGRSVTRYQDVEVEVLAGRDEATARRFVADELGPLSEDGAMPGRLRQALLAYLSHGQNAAAGAASLELSPRTFRYRLRRAEELLGTSIGARSLELHTALRLLPLVHR